MRSPRSRSRRIRRASAGGGRLPLQPERHYRAAAQILSRFSDPGESGTSRCRVSGGGADGGLRNAVPAGAAADAAAHRAQSTGRIRGVNVAANCRRLARCWAAGFRSLPRGRTAVDRHSARVARARRPSVTCSCCCSRISLGVTLRQPLPGFLPRAHAAGARRTAHPLLRDRACKSRKLHRAHQRTGTEHRDAARLRDLRRFSRARAALDGHGQLQGSGCVYRRSVHIAPGSARPGLTWRADMRTWARTPRASRGHVRLGAAETTSLASGGDQYAAKHNPFVYFHSIHGRVAQQPCGEPRAPAAGSRARPRTTASSPPVSAAMVTMCAASTAALEDSRPSTCSCAAGCHSSTRRPRSWPMAAPRPSMNRTPRVARARAPLRGEGAPRRALPARLQRTRRRTCRSHRAVEVREAGHRFRRRLQSLLLRNRWRRFSVSRISVTRRTRTCGCSARTSSVPRRRCPEPSGSPLILAPLRGPARSPARHRWRIELLSQQATHGDITHRDQEDPEQRSAQHPAHHPGADGVARIGARAARTTIGSTPRMNANEVMRIGRKRSRAASSPSRPGAGR